MATSIIDGTIEEATLKRSFYKMRVFNPVVIRKADGTIENLGKRIVHSDFGAKLTPGQTGRFYLHSTIGHPGIHGLRDAQGQSIFAFPRNNEIVGFVSIGLAGLLYLLHYRAGMPLSNWAPILLVSGIGLAFIFWRVRNEADRQFREDQTAGAAT